jgi:hypothetical protein
MHKIVSKIFWFNFFLHFQRYQASKATIVEIATVSFSPKMHWNVTLLKTYPLLQTLVWFVVDKFPVPQTVLFTQIVQLAGHGGHAFGGK